MPDSRIGEIQFKCFATQKLMFFQVISKNLELQPTLCGKPQKLGSKEKMWATYPLSGCLPETLLHWEKLTSISGSGINTFQGKYIPSETHYRVQLLCCESWITFTSCYLKHNYNGAPSPLNFLYENKN